MAAWNVALPFPSKPTILFGPAESGRTSLAFSVALREAEEGRTVYFVSFRDFPQLPTLWGRDEDYAPAAPALKRMTMFYISSVADLVCWLSDVHTGTSEGELQCPSLVIVDDFDCFLPSSQTPKGVGQAAVVCSYLLDVCAYFSSKDSKCCALVTMKEVPENDGRHSLFNRWFKDQWIIRKSPQFEKSSHALLVKTTGASIPLF